MLVSYILSGYLAVFFAKLNFLTPCLFHALLSATGLELRAILALLKDSSPLTRLAEV